MTPHGRIVNYVAVKHDSTRERQLEDQLRQAQKMESVGRLAGGVAHDFNNMLQVITSYVELSLAQVDAGNALHKNLQQIQKAAQRSAELTGQLLAFARKQTVSPQVLDVNDAVAGMLKMLQRLIGEDIDLAWMPGHAAGKIHDRSLPARPDPGQPCRQRAGRHRGCGKAHHRDRHRRDRRSVLRRLIPAHVPGTFVQLDGERRRLRHEQGDAVPHVRAVLHHQGGRRRNRAWDWPPCTASSSRTMASSTSTASRDREPRSRSICPVTKARPPPPGAETERTEPPRGTETVLVVEDEAAILELSKLMLENLGYTALTARTPAEAIRLVHEHDGAHPPPDHGRGHAADERPRPCPPDCRAEARD